MCMPEQTLRILYSCSGCGLDDRALLVPIRGPEEDVVHYVRETIAPAVQADHMKQSPLCRSNEMRNLKIPISGASRVGDPPLQ